MIQRKFGWLSIILLLLLIIKSCQVSKFCRHDVSQYPTLNYKIIEKNPIDTIENEILYRATVLIKDNRTNNLTKIPFHPDSIICYSLNICKKESLVQANFITSEGGVDLIQKYNIDHFSYSDIKNQAQYDELVRSFFGSFYIEEISKNWRTKLNSNYFTSVVFRIERKPRRFKNTVLKIDYK